ncbi:MAG: helix-hairpin-helix domain-containing protein [Nitrospirota bacterium]
MTHRTSTTRIVPLIVAFGFMFLSPGPTFLFPRLDQTASAGTGSTFPPQVQRPPDIAVERLDRPPRDRPDEGRLLDLNTASLDQLTTLPGVDDTTARSIIGGRPYRTRDDLVGKGILSEAAYETIKDHVTVAPE